MTNSISTQNQMNDAPKRMIDAAICAYSVDSRMKFQPKAMYWDTIGVDPNQKLTTFTSGYDGVDAGFVAFTKDDWVVISLRGTLSSYYSWQSFMAFLDDWWQDDETKPVEFKIDSTTSFGHVEKGFLKALWASWPHICNALKGVDWRKKQGIQITGHSKGAGMTFLLAALLNHMCPKDTAIHVHAFAAPLSGMPDFAHHYSKVGLDATSMRYQRECDLVPFVPPSKDWNILEHIHARTSTKHFPYFEIHPFAAFLEGFGETLYKGYQEMGDMTFLPNPASKAPPQTGSQAQKNAQAAIVAAIEADQIEKIADAHSAVHSYWPALYQLAVETERLETALPQNC